MNPKTNDNNNNNNDNNNNESKRLISIIREGQTMMMTTTKIAEMVSLRVQNKSNNNIRNRKSARRRLGENKASVDRKKI